MRPIRIEMSAFGPYAGKQTVEMDRLGTSGIYLITGDTGAGKTPFSMPSSSHFTEPPAATGGAAICCVPAMRSRIPPRR